MPFADSTDAQTILASFLRAQLTSNCHLRRWGRETGVALALCLREPDARMTAALSAADGEPCIYEGHDGPEPDALLTMASSTAHRYWRGQVDIAAATRSGEITVQGPRSTALATMSVLGRLQARYERHLAHIGWLDRAVLTTLDA